MEMANGKPLGTLEQFDELADRLQGKGMQALRGNDWGLICIALEEAVANRKAHVGRVAVDGYEHAKRGL